MTAKNKTKKPKAALSSRLMVRLLNAQRKALKDRAEIMGVADSTLGRVYILEGLARGAGNVDQGR